MQPAQELTFVNITNPYQRDQGEAARHDVRSRAAVHSHQARRRRRLKDAVRASGGVHGNAEQQSGKGSLIPTRASSPNSSEDVLVVATRATLPSPLLLDASRKDPFNTYPVTPVSNRPWFGWVLDYCKCSLFCMYYHMNDHVDLEKSQRCKPSD